MLNDFSHLASYPPLIEKGIRDNLPLIGATSSLRSACEYALFSGGKKVRPMIVLMMAKALGFGGEALLSALGVEFFHTASLVVDDLPSMDDDDFRREQPSVHKKYGETAAILVSYALIAAGYGAIAKNAEILQQQPRLSSSASLRCQLALENAAYNTGLYGATGGQFLDLSPPDLSLSTIKQVIQQKTSSLFELSFVYGWLFGGGEVERLSLVKEAASHFGLAFQIADDLGDQEQDIRNGRKVNIANVLGAEPALVMFHEELSLFLLKIKELGVSVMEFEALAGSLKAILTG